MSNQLIARVAIESPLPQLDRLFDYLVADEILDSIAVGQRVRVTFGRSKAKLSGLVVELSQESEHAGRLSKVDEIVSATRVLKPSIYELCRQIADRQCTAISDVLRLAIPNRSVAVEKKWLAENSNEANAQPDQSKPSRRVFKITEIVQPICDPTPLWISKLCTAALDSLQAGQSAIICVPDLSDIRLVQEHLELLTSEQVSLHSELKGSQTYAAFLRCLEPKPVIVIGNRNALFAPVHNLGLISLWDDGDHSHIQQQSPYIHSRDIALMRQSIEKCSIQFSAHVRSAEVARLVSIGYLDDTTENFVPPKVATSDSNTRLDTAAWLAIREASQAGPVLVQVAAKGTSTSLFCAKCTARASCLDCNGPLWVNDQNQNSCRWCNRISLDVKCLDCGSSVLRQGRAGATRTSAEIGKMFPGVKILTSSGSDRLHKVDSKPKVVVATPGAEPIATGGYRAVVVLDGDQLLRRDTMRATEDAVRAWSNAIALLGAAGRALIVGISGKLATDLSLWNQGAISQREYDSRVELDLPPAIRVATITSDRARLEECSAALAEIADAELYGPSQRGADLRLLIKFSYRSGAKIAEALKVLVLSSSTGGAVQNAKSGRAQRALKIKIDDPEVI